LLKRCATIAVRKCISGVYFQSCVDLTDRPLVIAALVITDAEQMQTVEMTRVNLQDVPIYLFRI